MYRSTVTPADYESLPTEPPYSNTKNVIDSFRGAFVRGGMEPSGGLLWQGTSGNDFGYTSLVTIPGKKPPMGLRFWAATRGSWRKFRSKLWYVGLCDVRGVPFTCCRSSGGCRTRTPEQVGKWFDEMADTLFLNADRYVTWSRVLKKIPCGVQDALVSLLQAKRRGRELDRLTTRCLLKIHRDYETSAGGKTAWNLISAFAAEACNSEAVNMRLHSLEQCWVFTKPFLESLYDKGVSA